MRRLRVGTRGSRLALIQAQAVCALLQGAFPETEVEVVPIKTQGDLMPHRLLKEMGGRGVFVKEIERALLAGEVDLAVHSAKDMPSSTSEGLEIALVPRREDPRDCLACGGPLSSVWDLPPMARVGSSSPRRRVQLLGLRGDLQVLPVRGNVDRRLGKMREGQFDALLLGAAGLRRLGLVGEISYAFDVDEMVPAPGQGTLVVQCRAEDEGLLSALRPLSHRDSFDSLMAERAFQASFGGGCHAPMGVFCRFEGEEFEILAFASDEEGSQVLRERVRGKRGEEVEVARELGRAFGERLGHVRS